MARKLYQQNSIEPEEIGTKYTMMDVLEIMTENYLVQQGIMEKTTGYEDLEGERQPLNASTQVSTEESEEQKQNVELNNIAAAGNMSIQKSDAQESH
jgi:hypothetical protein